MTTTLGAGGRQHQGNRKMHEQWMKFADERHERPAVCCPALGSSRLAYTDRGAGGYIPRVVSMRFGNKPAADGVLGSDDASIL